MELLTVAVLVRSPLILFWALISLIKFSDANSTVVVKKSVMDSKRTHDIVDKAFLEQKDVLLDMLETKLKEVRDKKKKKSSDKTDSNTIILESKHDLAVPMNGELKLSANGISAVGEVNAHLKFGDTGKGTLKLNATGISNVGRSHLDMGVEDGTIHIPGISNLFMGNILSSNCAHNKEETESELNKLAANTMESRRSKLNDNVALSDTGVNNTAAKVTVTHDATDSGDINVNIAASTEAPLNGTAANETANAVL